MLHKAKVTVNLFCRRKPGPLGQVRDNRLCHLSKLFVVSGVRFQVSGFRKQYEVIANCVDVKGIGENIGANDSRRKAAQAAIPKLGFI